MPVFTQRHAWRYGVGYGKDGSTGLTGKNYLSRREVSKPAMPESRAKPLDCSQFSLSNTARTFVTVTDTDSTIGYRAYPQGGYEACPVGWNGGVGSWGLSTPNYSPDLDVALKVKNQKANLGVTLAKYRELCVLFSRFTGDLVHTAANLQRLDNRRRKNLLHAANLSKSGRHKNRIRQLEKAASFHPLARAAFKGASVLYLGYLFGLRQFAQDLAAVSEVLRRRFDDPMYLQGGFTKHLWDEKTRVGNVGSISEWKAVTTSQVTHRIRYRFRVFPNQQALAQMGMTNPLAIAYDYIPFSFVLNWIIPIGKYIAALDALEGISDLRWYYTTQESEYTIGYYPRYNNATAFYKIDRIMRSGVKQTLKPRFPTFEPSTSANNVLTGVALLGALKKNPVVANAMLRTRR